MSTDLVVNGRFLTQRITGVQRYAHELLRALDRILSKKPELSVTVLTPRLSGIRPKWQNIALREVGHLSGHAWEQFELPWYARGKILFCPGNTAPLFSLLTKRHVVVTVHDLSYKYFPEAYRPAFRLWYRLIIPAVLRRADAVITVSEAERRAILAHYPEATERLHAIQNGGLDPEFSQVHLTVDTPQKYILYVGSLSKRKNIAGIVEAASRLARKRGFHFVFVGSTASSLATAAIEVPDDIRSRMTFVGQIDDIEKLIRYYRGATCLLFPSFYEASPLPPIEAMACGCPVIAAEIPALTERCGNAAAYCDPHRVDSIVAAVERVIDDPLLQRITTPTRLSTGCTFYLGELCASHTTGLM